jgi:hypothetical protein
LPMFPGLEASQQTRVAKEVVDFIAAHTPASTLAASA